MCYLNNNNNNCDPPKTALSDVFADRNSLFNLIYFIQTL